MCARMRGRHYYITVWDSPTLPPFLPKLALCIYGLHKQSGIQRWKWCKIQFSEWASSFGDRSSVVAWRGHKIESSWFAVILRHAWERMEVGCLIFSPLISMLLPANRGNSRPAARWGATTSGRWTDQGQAGEGEEQCSWNISDAICLQQQFLSVKF